MDTDTDFITVRTYALITSQMQWTTWYKHVLELLGIIHKFYDNSNEQKNQKDQIWSETVDFLFRQSILGTLQPFFSKSPNVTKVNNLQHTSPE